MGAVEMYGWSPDDKKWVKLQLDSDGSIHVVGYVDELDDIGDVDVAAPTDDYVLYWDEGDSKWKCKDIDPVAVAAVEAAGLTLAAAKKIIIANDGVIQLGTLDGSPTVRGGRAAHPTMLIVQPKDGNRIGEVCVIPSGTSNAAYFCLYNSSDLENYGYLDLYVEGDQARFLPSKVGTGTAPIRLRFAISLCPDVTTVDGLGETYFQWKHIKAVNHYILKGLTSDHPVSGLLVEITTAGEDLVLGDAVYMKSDGKMWKSDADLATTMPVMALAAETIATDALGQFLLQGFMYKEAWDWTIGGIIYASVTPGALSQTAPGGSGDQVQVVGIAMSADIIYFNPSYELVEIS